MPPIQPLKYFQPSEFHRFALMDAEFLAYLDETRSRCGFSWFLTSDARDAAANKRAGGVATSLHLADPTAGKLARAVDFVTATLKSGERPYAEFMRFAMAAMDARDALVLPYSVQVEVVYADLHDPKRGAAKPGFDRHYHLGLHRDASRPDELIFARD